MPKDLKKKLKQRDYDAYYMEKVDIGQDVF